MKKILAFAGSNSRSSINKQLVVYAATLVKDTSVDIIDLNNYSLPVFSVDIEKEQGFPAEAIALDTLFKKYDGFILSLAEHNGNFSAAFKNLFDWMSRIERQIFRGKPMLLMSTSPGARGGASVLQIASNSFPRFGADIQTTFSLSNFYENFKEGKIIVDDFNDSLERAVLTFERSIN